MDKGDSFELKLNLRDIDKKLHYKIGLLKEKYIAEKIHEYYWPLGVSENTLII